MVCYVLLDETVFEFKRCDNVKVTCAALLSGKTFMRVYGLARWASRAAPKDVPIDFRKVAVSVSIIQNTKSPQYILYIHIQV